MEEKKETEIKEKKKIGRPRKYHTKEEYRAQKKKENDRYSAKMKKMRELCKQLGAVL